MDLHSYSSEVKKESSQFNMHCTNFTVGQWKSLNLIRSVGASIGVVILFAILFFLIHSKAYKTLFQRLYFYLIIVTILNQLTGIVSIEHQWQYDKQDTVCKWVRVFTGWTYVQVFIFSYEVISYLLYLVVSNIWGTRLPTCGIGCCSVVVEIIYVALPVSVSTVFVLPPYIQDKYGIAGPWCFVQSINSSCEPTGKGSQIAFYSMYLALGVGGIAASLVFRRVCCLFQAISFL